MESSLVLISSLIFSLTPIIKDILYRDYNKYDDLIYDLRQIKLFYAKENDTYTNRKTYEVFFQNYCHLIVTQPKTSQETP